MGINEATGSRVNISIGILFIMFYLYFLLLCCVVLFCFYHATQAKLGCVALHCVALRYVMLCYFNDSINSYISTQ